MRYLFQILTIIILASCAQVDSKNVSKAVIKKASTNLETNTFQLKDTTAQFLWREMKYDTALKDSFNSIFINEEYLKTITDPEKATIGYIATFIGNECWWDGEANGDRSNLDCKIISALGLGYQCSNRHLGFLRQWFAKDKKILSELDLLNCPTTPYTATSQNTFDEIKLTVKNDTIIVFFKANGINMRKQTSWNWSETNYFRFVDNSLELIKVDKSEVQHENFEISEE